MQADALAVQVDSVAVDDPDVITYNEHFENLEKGDA